MYYSSLGSVLYLQLEGCLVDPYLKLAKPALCLLSVNVPDKV